MRKKVLIFTDYYTPSIKGGGPIQSIKNMVDNLSDKIDFYIVAADRDLGDKNPFENNIENDWVSVGNAKVLYTNVKELNLTKIKNIINSQKFDVMYLNSFFSYKLSIIPVVMKKLNIISNLPIVLAPRGQFSPGALNLKNNKKNLYIKVTKALGIYNNLTWHATAETEFNDIKKIFGENAKIKIANNLTANYNEKIFDKSIKKFKGHLKIVFISRIHPKKNLKQALNLLKKVERKIEYNIYGPIEDKVYWSECDEIIHNLPENITVTYKGALSHEKIISTFETHHIFLFPTLGENYGHVISEAFIGGCPVIISDQTPWRNLENKKVGRDIALSNEHEFIESINYYADLNKDEYDKLALNAFEYGKSVSNSNQDLRATYDLFK